MITPTITGHNSFCTSKATADKRYNNYHKFKAHIIQELIKGQAKAETSRPRIDKVNNVILRSITVIIMNENNFLRVTAIHRINKCKLKLPSVKVRSPTYNTR